MLRKGAHISLMLAVVLSMFTAVALNKLTQMPIGTRISDNTTTAAASQWVVQGIVDNQVTLTHAYTLGKMAYDAAEPTNPDADIQTNGDATWATSNIHQWLNASGTGWFTPQTEYDTAPAYATSAGYLNSLHAEFKLLALSDLILPMTWSDVPYNGNIQINVTYSGSTQCQLVPVVYKTTPYTYTAQRQVYVRTDNMGTYVSSWGRGAGTWVQGTASPPAGCYAGSSTRVSLDENGEFWQVVTVALKDIYRTENYTATGYTYNYQTSPIWTRTASSLQIKDTYKNNALAQTTRTAQLEVMPMIALDGSDVWVAATASGGVYKLVYNTPSTAPTMLKLTGPKDMPGMECMAVASGSTDVDNDSLTYMFEMLDVDTGVWTQIGESIGGALRYKVPAKEKLSYNMRVRTRDARNRLGPYLTMESVEIAQNNNPQAPLNVHVSSQRQGVPAKVTCDAAIDVDGDPVEYMWEIEAPGTGLKQVIQTAKTAMDFAVPADAPTFEIRVKAVDSHGLESEYGTTGPLSVLPNQAPSVPTVVTVKGQRVGKVGTAVASTCEDIEGDAVMYAWQQRVDGGDWVSLGTTVRPKLAYVIPAGTRYEIGVSSVDLYGGKSAQLVSNVVKIFGANYPEPPEYSEKDGLTYNPELSILEADETDTNNDHIIYRIAE